MTFTAIVTSHDFERGLRSILGNLRYQTRPPDETIVLASGYDHQALKRIHEDFGVPVWDEPDKDDWGHAKRAKGVGLAQSEWLGFFNDDDVYERDYIETMLKAAGFAQIVYCNWVTLQTASGVDGSNCGFAAGSSTSGNFIVLTALAQMVAYSGQEYEADGRFIDALASRAERIHKVEDILYTHDAIRR